MNKNNIKAICLLKVSSQIDELQEMIKEVQTASNSETKSTAGDKHETARAQAQNEKDRLSRQLSQLQSSYRLLHQVPTTTSEQIQLGSFVKTSQGDFYVSTGLGSLKTEEGAIFFAISLNAPLGQRLLGKRVGDHLEMPNGKSCEVLEVH